jgi:hypothetical protein
MAEFSSKKKNKKGEWKRKKQSKKEDKSWGAAGDFRMCLIMSI